MPVKFNKLIASFLLLILMSCGSKKTFTQSEKKEDIKIDYTDNSKKKSEVEIEKQYVNTNTKERIVTMYGVHFDTIYIDGKPIIMPIPYITSKKEIRDINTENFLYRLHVKDSIENAISLRFKGKLELKGKELKEMKETQIYYQISFLVLSIIGLIFLVLYIIARTKLKRLIL